MEIITLRAGTLLPDLSLGQDVSFSDQAPVVQALDNAIHRINLWMTAAKYLGIKLIALSTGYRFIRRVALFDGKR